MGKSCWRCSIILLFLKCNPTPVTCLLVPHWPPLFFSNNCLQATAPHTMQNYFNPTALSWPIRERLMGVRGPRYLAPTGPSVGDGETTALWRRRQEGWILKKIKAPFALCSLAAVVAADPESVVRADWHCSATVGNLQSVCLWCCCCCRWCCGFCRTSRESSLHTTLCCVLNVWFLFYQFYLD